MTTPTQGSAPFKPSITRLFTSHYKIGYCAALWIGVIPFIFLFGIDLFRFIDRGLSLTVAWKIASRATPRELRSAALLVVAELVLLPVLIAAWRVLFGSNARVSLLMGRRSVLNTVLFIFTTAFVGSAVVVAFGFERASGFQWTSTGLQTDFASYLFSVASFLASPWVALGGLLLTVGGIWLKSLTTSGDLPAPVKTYATKLYLADLEPAAHPRHGRHRGNLNSGAVAPAIKLVEKRVSTLDRHYQETIPGSKASSDFVLGHWLDAKRMLKQELEIDADRDDRTIRLFPNTSRALCEVLLESGAINGVLVSPFEHPSEKEVLQWLARFCSVRPVFMNAIESQFADDWDVGLAQMVDNIASYFCDKPLGVFLISEVVFLTGDVLPIPALWRAVHARCLTLGLAAKDLPRLVVDGAHSLGNLPKPRAWRDADAYVLSAHKWLMSSQAAGIAVSRQTTDVAATYDAMGQKLPPSRVSERSVFSLKAAMELLSAIAPDERLLRSNTMRHEVLTHLGGCARELNKNTTLPKTAVLALIPGTAWKWKYSSRDLEEFFESEGLSVSVFVYGSTTIVRLALTYFLDITDARRASVILRKALVDA